MEILDGTIIATAAPAIAADLDVRAVDINLAMTAYLITLAVGIPLSGWLADRFGARRIFTTAIAIFTLASLLCALSPNLGFLCTARVLQGLGGAMMVPVGRLVVLRDAQRKEFLEAIAYLTWPALIAPVLAPVLGGLLATYASWHWIFLINIPLGVLAFLAALKVVPELRARKVPPFDWAGFIVCGTALAALVMGMELVGSDPTPWTAVMLLLLLAAVAAAATLWWFKRTPHPLLDLRALRIRTFLVGNAGGSLYRLVVNAVPFLLPLMFMLGFGWTAVDAGLMTMFVFAGNVLIKPATSPLIRRCGFRAVLLLSSLGGAVTLAVCAFLTEETSAVMAAAVLFLSGVFRSIGFSAYNTLQFVDVPKARMAGANTLSSTIGQIATGLGIAVAALTLRGTGALLGPDAPALASFHWTFGVLAALMLYPAAEAALLPRTAGDEARAK